MANELNIVNDPQLNELHKLISSDHTKAIKNDLYKNFIILQENRGKGNTTKKDFVDFVCYYTIDLLISYYNNGIQKIPQAAYDDISDQVLASAKSVFQMFKEKEVIETYEESLKVLVHSENIIETTEEYLKEFKYF